MQAVSYAHRSNTEASVTTISHSPELCILDVNTQSPWNPWATRQRTWKLQEESKGRQELFARFPGYLYALLAILQACSILHVLSRGSWLLTQKLCKFLGWSVGRERQSPWKNACKNSVHVAIYNNSMRLSLTHDWKYAQDLQHLPRTKETNEKQRHRQWIIPGGGSFPQSPQMQEYEYFTKCIYKKESPVPYFCQMQEIGRDFASDTHNEFGCTNSSSCRKCCKCRAPIFQANKPPLQESPPLHFPSRFC